jgi:hypothetical protein
MVYIYKIVIISLMVFTLFFLGITIIQYYSLKKLYDVNIKERNVNLLLIKKVNDLKKQNLNLNNHIHEINKDSMLTNYCYDYLRWRYSLVIKEEN